eukprot:2240523-Ditylum_brightwellii.AAC.1
MQLSVDSDTAYLVLPGARSRFAGHFYLEPHPHALHYNKVPNNAPIHTECQMIKSVICSAAEAGCSRLFHNSQTAIAIQHILKEIGHLQRPTK